MANLIRKNQQEVVEPLRLMRELFNWDPFAEMMPAGQELQGFAPRFEVKETKDAFIFRADLPGVEEKDLELTMTGNRLTVSGKREAEARHEDETWYAYERTYGTFTRSFTLPEGADLEHADGELKSGVLTISIPKRPEHQPRKINLKSLGDKVRTALGGKEKAQT